MREARRGLGAYERALEECGWRSSEGSRLHRVGVDLGTPAFP